MNNHVRVVDTRCNELEFDLSHKYTIITGDSGRGKTRLLYNFENGVSYLDKPSARYSATIYSDYQFVVLHSNIKLAKKNFDWVQYLKSCGEDESTVFCFDEDFTDSYTQEFQEAMIKTKFKFLIVSRYPLHYIPYGVDDILFVTKNDGRLSLSKLDLSNFSLSNVTNVNEFVCEDSGSGFKFFSAFLPNVTSADGRSNIKDLLYSKSKALFCVDGLGFGANIMEVRECLNQVSDKFNYVWIIDSFEKLVLESVFIKCGFTDVDPPDLCPNKEEYYSACL